MRPRWPDLLALLAAAACTPSVVEPIDPHAPPLEEVVLVVDGGAELTLAGAWLDAEGEGRGVEALATVPGHPPLEIRSDRTEWRLSERRISFTGAVRAVRGELTLVADKIEVYLRDEVVDRALAEGRVRITHQGREATAERALFEPQRERVELKGDPRLRQGGRTMRGHRLVIHLDDERVVCEDCRVTMASDPP